MTVLSVRPELVVAGNGRPAPARPLLSVVLPAHNEAEAIGATLERLAAVAEDLAGRLEVIIVSDGSVDATFEMARDGLRRRGLEGRVVELATNAGSHAAMRCGLGFATGEYVAIMSADGQDPPEALPAMLGRFEPEIDIVWGRRERREDGIGVRLAAATFYRLFRVLAGLDYPPSGLDFLVVRRRVVDAVLARSTRNASLFLVIYNLGFAQAFSDYERGARAGGRSSWTLQKRIKLALDMLTGCSAAPIRIASLTGVVAGLIGVTAGGVMLVRAAAGGVHEPAWASLMVLSSLMSGFALIAIGFLGEYVWRILDEVRGAPQFIEARDQRVAADASLEEL
jgi:polyisoprenyl-phosphate glycosyltransferase